MQKEFLSEITKEEFISKGSIIILEIVKWAGKNTSGEVEMQVFDTIESAEKYVDILIKDVTFTNYTESEVGQSNCVKAWRINPSSERYIIRMYKTDLLHFKRED